MDLYRGIQKFFAESEKRGASPRLRASRGFSGGMGEPSPGIVSSSRGLLPRVPAALGVATGGALNIMARGAVIPSIIETAQSVFNPSDNIVTAFGDLGTAVHNQFAPPEQRKLYNPIPRNDPRNARIIRERDSARDASRPEGSMATLGGKPVQWMDNRWVPFLTEGQMARQEQARIRAQAPAALTLPSSSGVTPIIQGTRDGVTPDRTQSDEYKAQLAQYGALQKAKKFEEADKLGMEIWRDKYGKTAMGQPKGAVGTDNPLMRSTFPEKYAPQAFGVPQGFDVSGSFSIGANAVPAPWNTQGASVSAPYQQAMQQAAEKTTGEGMPDFSTTIGAQVAEALGRPEYARFLGKK